MILALIACALSLAAGSEAELTNVGSLGSIEEVYLDRAKAALQCRADPKPEGKKVRAVRAVVFEAITPDDPWPDFFGRFHIETKSDVVTNESLLQPGDAWSRDLAWQTEYNLLNDYYLSIARVVACEVPGATAAAVDILIVVKDLWSLRGSLDPRVVGGTLEYLYFSFGEFNILGRNKKATVDFLMDRSIYSLGGTVTERPDQWITVVRGVVGERPDESLLSAV